MRPVTVAAGPGGLGRRIDRGGSGRGRAPLPPLFFLPEKTRQTLRQTMAQQRKTQKTGQESQRLDGIKERKNPLTFACLVVRHAPCALPRENSLPQARTHARCRYHPPTTAFAPLDFPPLRIFNTVSGGMYKVPMPQTRDAPGWDLEIFPVRVRASRLDDSTSKKPPGSQGCGLETLEGGGGSPPRKASQGF